MSSITIEVPDSLKNQVQKLGNEKGFSLEQFFVAAASEKLSVIEDEGFIQARADQANDAEFEAVLKEIPVAAPIKDWDQISG